MREVVSTRRAPLPAAPYSQAIKAGGFCFTAGQVPIDPETGKMVQGDIRQQAQQVLENIEAIIEEAGTSMENVVKVTIFLRDLRDFRAVNEVYSQYFEENPPARTCVQAGRVPLDAGLEAEAIAIIPE
ncbi:MAG: RidA family protein [Candidatus Bathyarchaeia archaeon]